MPKGSSRRRRKLQDVIREPLKGGDPDFVPELHDASDRSAAILISANVARDLEQLIMSSIISTTDEDVKSRLLGRDGALSSFYGNIYLGHAIGLYGQEVLNNLEAIRRIRNVFAHAPSMVCFDLPEIVAECARFSVLDVAIERIEEAKMRLNVETLPPRILFINICFQMMTTLTQIGMQISKAKLSAIRREIRNLNRRAKKTPASVLPGT